MNVLVLLRNILRVIIVDLNAYLLLLQWYFIELPFKWVFFFRWFILMLFHFYFDQFVFIIIENIFNWCMCYNFHFKLFSVFEWVFESNTYQSSIILWYINSWHFLLFYFDYRILDYYRKRNHHNYNRRFNRFGLNIQACHCWL